MMCYAVTHITPVGIDWCEVEKLCNADRWRYKCKFSGLITQYDITDEMRQYLHQAEIVHLYGYVKANYSNNSVDWSSLETYQFKRSQQELQQFYERFILNKQQAAWDDASVQRLIEAFNEVSLLKLFQWKLVSQRVKGFSVKQCREMYESVYVQRIVAGHV